jgi:hypothetical protein
MTTYSDHKAFGSPAAPGLTKREYFAAIALEGFLARGLLGSNDQIAECAVRQADALIAALNAPVSIDG